MRPLFILLSLSLSQFCLADELQSRFSQIIKDQMIQANISVVEQKFSVKCATHKPSQFALGNMVGQSKEYTMTLTCFKQGTPGAVQITFKGAHNPFVTHVLSVSFSYLE